MVLSTVDLRPLHAGTIASFCLFESIRPRIESHGISILRIRSSGCLILGAHRRPYESRCLSEGTAS